MPMPSSDSSSQSRRFRVRRVSSSPLCQCSRIGRHHALCAVDDTRRALEGGRRIESVAALLETIVENVADTMDRISDRIAKSLDEIEEQVLSDDATDLRQVLGRRRRSCVRLHRQLSGLRLVFYRLGFGQWHKSRI